jgi:hypothetical protein
MDILHIVKYRYEVQEQKEVPVWYTGPFRDWSNGKTILDPRKAKWNHPGMTRRRFDGTATGQQYLAFISPAEFALEAGEPRPATLCLTRGIS